MRLKSISNPPPHDAVVRLTEVSAPMVQSVVDLERGEFVLLFETHDGLPSERLILGVARLAEVLLEMRARKATGSSVVSADNSGVTIHKKQ